MQNISRFETHNKIGELIKKVQGMKSNAKGSNKECFFIDGYALLKTKSINEQELQQRMKIEKQLKEKGVNIVSTLEYQTDGMEDEFGFKKGYILQEMANGQLLHKSVNMLRMNETELEELRTEYISTLKALQIERQEFYDKFVSDWIEITKAGLKVDPSKVSNFYYEKGKQINFIDLDVGERFKGNIELETICAEMAVVIANGSRYYHPDFRKNPQIIETANETLSPIFKKLTESFVRQGLDREQVKQILKGIFPKVNLDEKDGHKLEQTPEGLSQAQIERRQEDKAARERTDMVTLPNGIQIPKKQYEQEYATGKAKTEKQEQPSFEVNGFGEIIRPVKGDEQAKKISISEVKESISKGKVTTQENQNATQDMRKLMEIKRLQIMQRTGQTLTPEQKQLLDEHIRQTNKAQVRFRNQQAQKKSKGLSL